jgi:DsbC/DsbD-like thiol-disulfide interchange protein
LDRNFDVAWNLSGGISSCSQRYPGPKAFSEPETKAIREVFHRYSHKIIAYFNVHADVYNYMTFKVNLILRQRGLN